MVQTRQGADTSKDASKNASKNGPKAQDMNNKENEPPAGTPPQQRNTAPASKKGSKRKSILEDSASEDATSKKRKASGSKKTATPTKKDEKKTNEAEVQQSTEEPKPRLTTPDIGFDYDRSKLRDPRPTPGRKARPRYERLDIPEDVKARLEATREIFKAQPPSKGRLTNAIKSKMIVEEARNNPLATFHDLYRCYDKGRNGSPTYDNAGFEMDYDKVADWMKPQPYNKARMVKGMDRAVERREKLRKEMFDLFFEKTDEDMEYEVEEVVKDQVSKDIGVPLHQIGPEQVKIWREKGFKPVKFEEWWTEPSAEDSKRTRKMMGGVSMRKHL
jgi:hypothetical protein